MLAAHGAIDPFAGAVGVIFLFPDRQPGFGLINYVTTRIERRSTMSGTHADPHREFTNLQRADSVNATNAKNLKLCARLLQDPATFTFSQRRERLILQRRDGPTLIVITYPACKCDARAGMRIPQLALQDGGLDREG